MTVSWTSRKYAATPLPFCDWILDIAADQIGNSLSRVFWDFFSESSSWHCRNSRRIWPRACRFAFKVNLNNKHHESAGRQSQPEIYLWCSLLRTNVVLRRKSETPLIPAISRLSKSGVNLDCTRSSIWIRPDGLSRLFCRSLPFSPDGTLVSSRLCISISVPDSPFDITSGITFEISGIKLSFLVVRTVRTHF